MPPLLPHVLCSVSLCARCQSKRTPRQTEGRGCEGPVGPLAPCPALYTRLPTLTGAASGPLVSEQSPGHRGVENKLPAQPVPGANDTQASCRLQQGSLCGPCLGCCKLVRCLETLLSPSEGTKCSSDVPRGGVRTGCGLAECQGRVARRI